MKETGHAACAAPDEERLLADLQSPDADVRTRAIHAVCPCRVGWELFERHMAIVARLKKDPSPAVRASAQHVFEDAAEMQCDGLPTNPREMTDEMLRTRRRSRFRPDEAEPNHEAAAHAGRRKHRH